MNLRELEGKSYACLPGCGFCCTFPAAVTPEERKRLQARGAGAAVQEKRGALSLKLQGGCGACALLKDRACTAYEARPSPCRFFPYHVYFGRHTEVYVDYSCRGVVHAPGSDLNSAFQDHVLANVPLARVEREMAEGLMAHREFELLARSAGVWDDPERVLQDLLSLGPDLLTTRGVMTLAIHAGEEETPQEVLQRALTAWSHKNPTHRPYYLDPQTRWLTYAPEGTGLRLLEMSESGAFTPLHLLEGLAKWEEPHYEVRHELFRYLERLVARDVFLGSAFALVDENGYEHRVREAVAARLGEVVVDLALRARMVPLTLKGRELTPAEVADEVARFYDCDFLDAPTIGGFL